MRLRSAFKYDVLFQIRHGFYAAYAIVAIVYIIVINSLPEQYRAAALTVAIFIDASILGFFFVGGIILMERSQKIVEALFVTPFRYAEYYCSKVLSLTVLASLVSVSMVLFVKGIPRHPLIFMSGVLLSSIFFVLLGILAATRAKSINGYFITSIFYVTVLMTPLLGYFRIFDSGVFYLLPSKASLLLFIGAFEGLETKDLVYSLLYLPFCSIPVAYLGDKWFRMYVMEHVGDDK
ncbi:hypothetical protein KAJ27_24810 [bacterium]|nr:hypothetical protein [bacterium]